MAPSLGGRDPHPTGGHAAQGKVSPPAAPSGKMMARRRPATAPTGMTPRSDGRGQRLVVTVGMSRRDGREKGTRNA